MVEPASVQLSGIRTQLSEKEDSAVVAVCSAGDLHRHLEPRQKERATSRSVRKTSNCKKSFIQLVLFYLGILIRFMK